MSGKSAKKSGQSKSPEPKRTSPNGNAIDLLMADHRRVEDLFAAFEEAAGSSDKRAIANQICMALKVHAQLEEELFYPAAFAATGEGGLLQEAMVEHASAKDLIAQIEASTPDIPSYDARVTVLREYVAHHVAEEEGELFPKFRKSDLDLEELGALLKKRQQEHMNGLTISNPALAIPPANLAPQSPAG